LDAQAQECTIGVVRRASLIDDERREFSRRESYAAELFCLRPN